jgi:hypothetical protein
MMGILLNIMREYGFGIFWIKNPDALLAPK